jgi:divalent metal cation (Fe/Co/Zn/Cd) transporter
MVPRSGLVSCAIGLSFFTIALNGCIGSAALVAALLTGSSALAAFALNALLDSLASVIMVWRFRRERDDPAAAEHLERRAQPWISAAMAATAIYVGLRASRALIDGSQAHGSAFGVALAVAGLLVLPPLGMMKLRVARALRSASLRGDAVLTLAGASLAAITLAAIITVAATDVWYADPAAALVISAALGVEAVRIAYRHRFG